MSALCAVRSCLCVVLFVLPGGHPAHPRALPARPGALYVVPVCSAYMSCLYVWLTSLACMSWAR
eukprot:586738-Rhodomonas_salina.1